MAIAATADKVCTVCKKELPATREFFYEDKRLKDGLTCHCKICDNKAARIYRNKNKEKMKKKSAEYRRNNKEYIKLRDCEYHKKNRDAILKQQLVYRKVHKEEIRIRDYEWRKNNKEYISKRDKIYRENNPEIKLANEAKRRAWKLNQTPLLTQDEKQQIISIYKKSVELGENWQVDHIIPLAKGGLHHPDNLQIVVKKYNLQKGSKLNFRLPLNTEVCKWLE